MEENIQLNRINSNSEDGKLICINQQPVMECALNLLTELAKYKTISLTAKGDSIPTAVAVANVITENMMKGNSKILAITVDSERSEGNALVSTIKITIIKTN
jgi:archaea-specific DNA-binding protein